MSGKEAGGIFGGGFFFSESLSRNFDYCSRTNPPPPKKDQFFVGHVI